MANKIFSGIRPSGKLHLGNYLGAIKNWIDLQDKPDTEQAIFAVVDYHGITTPFDPKQYAQQVNDTVLDYLAAGLDHNKSLIIRQSKIPSHVELGWIFGTITPVSWLDRLPTYKEKLEEIKKQSNFSFSNIFKATPERARSYQNNLGILAYPVLMAADILVYKSNLVPVGDDQKGHLDLTNEIGKKFNSLFGETFEAVKTYKSEGERIKSFQDPKRKMSKSADEGIALIDSPDVIREKIKKAVTDSGSEIKYDPENKPAISNLLTVHHLLSGKEINELVSQYEGKNYSDFKSDLADVVVEFLKPFQQRHRELSENMDQVGKILEQSEQKAREIGAQTLKEVKQKMGLL